MMLCPWRGSLPSHNLRRGGHSMYRRHDASKLVRPRLIVGAAADLAVLPPLAEPQLLADSGDSSATVASPAPAQRDLTYTRPTETTKLRNYAFDAFGPYSLAGAALAAGIGQADDRPPDWKQGAVGYGERFASGFGIAAIGTTTRYALAEALREDTL